MKNKQCNSALVLSDGHVFYGTSFGFPARTIDEIEAQGQHHFDNGVGELLFNTSMTGYVEIVTDPSFFGQIVCMTYPHIGNYGVDEGWAESGMGTAEGGAMLSGFVIHELYDGAVPKGRITLDAWLRQEKISGIQKVETRSLTLHIREAGEQNAAIVSLEDSASQEAVVKKTVAFLKSLPSMEGQNLINYVGQRESVAYDVPTHEAGHDAAPVSKNASVQHEKHLALYDCGCKHNIMRLLRSLGCKVTLLPHTASAEAILAQNFDMLLISNGPGDPAVLQQQITCIQNLVGVLPLRGICLGNQILAHALGAKTYKMPFGHHGANHPVKDLFTNKLYITSQNHGFAVDASTLPQGAQLWFTNTNDGTLEGFSHFEKNIHSVQFHPEAAPGPHDSRWIFESFLSTL